jgi:tRNA nucleotidyltransferase (CCA-adding enzyme)
MQVFQVGGSVRDRLLGIEAQDLDWVVVGASAQAMLDKGFKPVGADFPVFLHPQTQDEYALARVERKVGEGYLGFAVNTESVTLDQDLSRRDLTVNAMALDEDKQLIDPYGGAQDLKNRVLRHVSPSFCEDPVRILRVLRFRARYGSDWTVAETTWALMQRMVADGAAHHLVSERVWKEVGRALLEPHPHLFLEGMLALGLTELPGFSAYRAADSSSAALAQTSTYLSAPLTVRAVVGLSLAKGSAATEPHPPAGVPSDVWRLARATARFPEPPAREAPAWQAMLEQCAAYKVPALVGDLFQVWRCDGRAVPGAECILAAARAVDTKSISASLAPGPEVGKAIALARTHAIEAALSRTQS